MHCLHTQTQLLTDNDFCYPLGERFFFVVVLTFNCQYHYCYSLYFVLSFKIFNNPLTAEKKIYIFRILLKKK